jgi:chemotaxis signal transduction protein
MINNNQMIILVNEVEKVVKINPQEARETFQITQKKLARYFWPTKQKICTTIESNVLKN